LNKIYVFDACALIALLSKETGYENVERIIKEAKDKQATIKMHKINLYEVYYHICKLYDETSAINFLEEIKKSPIQIDMEITDEIIIKAGNLKRRYKMSLADSIGLGETIICNGSFVTADHHELDIVDKKEKINFTWIR
jgi:PIN domain nuclease of toxin-antitoxin system